MAHGPYLALREVLLLRIMDIAESAGSGLAFPSQTLYMAKEGGLDDNKGRVTMERTGRVTLPGSFA